MATPIVPNQAASFVCVIPHLSYSCTDLGVTSLGECEGLIRSGNLFLELDIKHHFLRTFQEAKSPARGAWYLHV